MGLGDRKEVRGVEGQKSRDSKLVTRVLVASTGYHSVFLPCLEIMRQEIDQNMVRHRTSSHIPDAFPTAHPRPSRALPRGSELVTTTRRVGEASGDGRTVDHRANTVQGICTALYFDGGKAADWEGGLWSGWVMQERMRRVSRLVLLSTMRECRVQSAVAVQSLLFLDPVNAPCSNMFPLMGARLTGSFLQSTR